VFYNQFEKIATELSKFKFDVDDDFRYTKSSVVCKNCGTTLQDFLDTAFVGCTKCYEMFKQYAINSAIDFHGRANHIGKVPKIEQTKASKKRELERLIREKELAAKAEDYILANELKVKIARLREELK